MLIYYTNTCYIWHYYLYTHMFVYCVYMSIYISIYTYIHIHVHIWICMSSVRQQWCTIPSYRSTEKGPKSLWKFLGYCERGRILSKCTFAKTTIFRRFSI